MPRTTKAGQPCTLPPAMATITSVSGEEEFCLPASLWQRFQRMLFSLVQHMTEIAVFCVLWQSCQLNSGSRICHVPLLKGEQWLLALGLYWCRRVFLVPVLPLRKPRGSGTAWLCAGSFCIAAQTSIPWFWEELDELNRSIPKAA